MTTDGGSGTVIIRYQLSADTYTTLSGGQVNDDLYGDSGLDVFVFNHVGVSNADTIFNFTSGTDQIDLRGLITTYDPLTDAITDYIQVTDSGADSEVRVDTTGSGSFGGDVLTATINGVTGLTDEQALLDNGTLII